jgi:hypothetical protein
MHRLCRLKVVGVLLTGTRRLLYIPAASFKLQLFTENSLLARLYKTLGIVMAVVYKLIYAPTHTHWCVLVLYVFCRWAVAIYPILLSISPNRSNLHEPLRPFCSFGLTWHTTQQHRYIGSYCGEFQSQLTIHWIVVDLIGKFPDVPGSSIARVCRYL